MGFDVLVVLYSFKGIDEQYLSDLLLSGLFIDLSSFELTFFEQDMLYESPLKKLGGLSTYIKACNSLRTKLMSRRLPSHWVGGERETIIGNEKFFLHSISDILQ